ncbi:MAG: CYTH domain-containing protein [Flavobacteriales bacterium]|nr:CYTH domain-containing protein [Flavobacteriales bacterium]
MGQEIERKYLVNHSKWKQLAKPEGELYRQGYLVTDLNKTIRVRQAWGKGFLTIKGPSVGARRLEYEYEIPFKEAEELLSHFAVSELSKVRYKLPIGNKVWEVDQFQGDNAGLLVAEIELESEDEVFDVPDWIGEEVTTKQEYYNSNLTTNPYKNWKPE